MLRDEWVWIDRNPLLHDGSMSEPSGHPYSTLDTGNATACVDKLEFREWTTDGYAGWFGPGREWWGTFLWTIAWPAHGILVGITASSTD